MKKTALFAAAMLAVSCAHGGKHGDEDKQAGANPAIANKLKALQPSKQSSGMVVLYRNTSFGGLFGPMPFNGSLWLDDQAVGDVHDNTFNMLELAPGRHSLRVLGTAPGMAIPLQATSVVNVNAAQVTWVELTTVQTFNNVMVQFKTTSAAAIDGIAIDCAEGFSLDLSPTQTTKL